MLRSNHAHACVLHRTHCLAPDRRLTKWENTLTRQLITEAVPFAFEKCLADAAVQNWGDNIQNDILMVRSCQHADTTGRVLKAIVNGSSTAAAVRTVRHYCHLSARCPVESIFLPMNAGMPRTGRPDSAAAPALRRALRARSG
jgi:hypothetical protein